MTGRRIVAAEVGDRVQIARLALRVSCLETADPIDLATRFDHRQSREPPDGAHDFPSLRRAKIEPQQAIGLPLPIILVSRPEVTAADVDILVNDGRAKTRDAERQIGQSPWRLGGYACRRRLRLMFRVHRHPFGSLCRPVCSRLDGAVACNRNDERAVMADRLEFLSLPFTGDLLDILGPEGESA